MKLIEVKERTPLLIEQLTKVWESSVKATHLFLSGCEIEKIKKFVPQALKGIDCLIVAESESKGPVAFMGVEEQTLEMLFIASEARGKGLGKKLIRYGIENHSVGC